MIESSKNPISSTRRKFLQNTTVASAGCVAAVNASFSPSVFAAGDDTIRVGLIGCGGRGTGAASQALASESRVKLVSMGDVFEDRLQSSLKSLKSVEGMEHKVEVPVDKQYVGFDAYKKVIASGVDVVLLTTPPHFRPMHMQAAVEAGKHVFAEKPCAVDAPGVHSVLRSCEEAKKKGLAVVSGALPRSHPENS
jgi:predicted dehydrogenase